MKIKVYSPNKYDAAEIAEAEAKAEVLSEVKEMVERTTAETPSEAEAPAIEPVAETSPPGGETLPVASEAPEAPSETKTEGSNIAHGFVVSWEIEQKPAYVIAHEKEVEELKNEFVLAAQRKSDLENELKSAKKEEREALKHYTQMLTRGPIKPAEPKPTTATTPGGQSSESPAATTSTTPAADSGATQSDAWRDASINQLSTLSEKLRERLIEAGAETIGTLEDLRAKVAEGKANWPKGIGAAKITQIEDAVIDWLTRNRDSFAFQSSQQEQQAADGGEGEILISVATPSEANEDWINTETWGMMPAAEKSAYLTARVRAIRGDDGNPEWAKPAVEGANYFDDGEQEFWATKAAGVEPPTLENFIATAACPWHPCDAQDDWLRGFASAFEVWAAEKETLGEDDGEESKPAEPVAAAVTFDATKPPAIKGWESF